MSKRKSLIKSESEDEKESESEQKEKGFKKKYKKEESFVELKKTHKSNLLEKSESNDKKSSYAVVLHRQNNNKESKEDLEKIKELEKVIVEKDKIINDLNNKLDSLNQKASNIFEDMKKEFNEKIKFQINLNEQIISENEKLMAKNDNLEKKLIEISKQNEKLSQNNKNNINNINNINSNKINKFSNNNININPSYKDEYIPNIDNKNLNVINISNIPNYNNININPQNEKNEIHIEQNIIPKKEKIEPIQTFGKPPLIGLQNIGATCYMNSTLQCLSQTKKLTNYFLKEGHRNRIINNNNSLLYQDDLQLAPVYLELIENLWSLSGKTYYAPYNFMNTITNMNPLFKRGEAGDAKDFIIFILEQMHKELKIPLKNVKMIKVPEQINQYDKQNTLNNFYNEFIKETSILSDLFFGFNETTNICLNCKNYYNSRNRPNPICYNYGIFNLIIFPLEEVKNMKNNQNMMNFQNFYQGPTNEVNIDDCFNYNQKTDLFTGENKNYCNICKKLSDSYYTSRIYISPEILILILNRGKGNIYNVKMNFTQTIDITNYVIQNENRKIIYNLYGVITHIGESGPNAHFVASCKSPVDGNWYRYNDARVDPINNFQKDIHDFFSPYILFYERA